MSVFRELRGRFVTIFTYGSAGWLGASLMRDYINSWTENAILPTIIAMAVLVLIGYWADKNWR